MKQKLNIVFLANFGLLAFNLLAVILNHLPATNTDNVVMMTLGAGPLKKLTLALAHRSLEDAAF